MPNVAVGELVEGRFRVLERIGRGGGGVVYRAHDATLGLDVALKTLDDLDADQLYRLKQEFRTLRELTHPNLAQLHELVADASDCFFTMELLDGENLLSHVRRGSAAGAIGPQALEQLRDAFRQLAEGVAYLHAAGQLHRDIKPSNVMVCRDGRVVLLDFGLAVPERARALSSAAGGFAGTLDYVAPEQAWGHRAVPASDWYSVGVTLYQALTGELPFGGTLAERLAAKSAQPPPPSGRASGIPSELDDLAHRLLSPDPESRPEGAEVLAILEGELRAPASHVPHDDRGPFVGRRDELEALAKLAGRVRAGSLEVVHIRASSGLGKTELARRFVERIERDEQALVLRGRCHPQETVHFAALDPLVDELSRYLQALPDGEVGPLLPRHAGALLRLFPVLGRVPALAAVPAGVLSSDPQELRRLGAQALRELLERIGDRRLLVLWIDDAQWGDRDSAPLLRELLRPPGSPRLMLILTYLREDEPDSPMLREFARLHGESESTGHRIDLSPLAVEESVELAAALGAGQDAPLGHRAESIAREAAGSPFFVGELVRYARQAGAPQPPPDGVWTGPSVQGVVRARLSELEPSSADLLELVSVAGRPIDVSLVLELSGLAGAGRPLIHSLSRECLLRTRSSEASEQVEAYHDRIRETVLETLDADVRRRRHRQLAEGLGRQPSPDLHALVEHYSGAGDPDTAAAFAVEAARAAVDALAFDRAAYLYGLALDLRSDRDADWPTRVRRAEALGYAGLGAEAGAAFEEAAASAERIEPDGERRRMLLRRAGEQYLYSGRLEQGLALMRQVLAELGSPVPGNPRLAALLLRARLLWKARRYTRGGNLRAGDPAGPSDVPSTELLDALETAARGTTMQDHALADALSLRHLLGAIERGEPSRLSGALALEASTEANVGGAWLRRRSRKLLDSAEELAARTGQPYDRLTVRATEGAVAWFNSEWPVCRVRCEEALDLLHHAARQVPASARAGHRGTPWESNLIHSFLLGALYQLGCLKELAARLPALIEDARARSDLFALSLLHANELVIVPLARDDPDGALRAADASMIPMKDDHFATSHYHHLVGTVKIDLYSGRGEGAWERVERAWKPLEASGFLGLGGVGLHLRYLRACAALACAVAGGGEGGSRGPLMAAEREAKKLARVPLSNGPPLAAAVRSVIAGLRDDRARQLAELERALRGFERGDMVLCTHAARLHLASLRDDPSARAQAAASERWMREEGVADPARLAACVVPAPGSAGPPR